MDYMVIGALKIAGAILGFSAVFIFTLWLLNIFSFTRYLALLVMPIFFVGASFLLGHPFEFGLVYFFMLALSLFVMFSGGYKHETKKGKRDTRYKNNEYSSTFSGSLRLCAFLGFLGLLVFGGLMHFGVLDPVSMGYSSNKIKS